MTSKIHSEIYRPLAWQTQFQNSFPSINWRAPSGPPGSDGPSNFSLASFRLSLISLCKVHEAHLQGCVNSQNNFAKIEFFTQQLTFFTRNISSLITSSSLKPNSRKKVSFSYCNYLPDEFHQRKNWKSKKLSPLLPYQF